MMKSSELLVIVDSVEEAVKFYTEKLAFDIVHLETGAEHSNALFQAHLRKGKCFVTFRIPHIEELAEFSFIKRCASRCVGLQIELKKGVEKYFQRCKKKGLKIIADLGEHAGQKKFSLKDPFGIKLVFFQKVDTKSGHRNLDFVGMRLAEQDIAGKGKEADSLIDNMVDHLKTFGILRRSGKKYAKLKLKQLSSKAK